MLSFAVWKERENLALERSETERKSAVELERVWLNPSETRWRKGEGEADREGKDGRVIS